MAVDGWMFDVFVENICIDQLMIITFFRVYKSSEHPQLWGEDRWETGWMNTDPMVAEYVPWWSEWMVVEYKSDDRPQSHSSDLFHISAQ